MLQALDARVRLVSARGEREIPVADLYVNDGMHYLTRQPDEILTGIRFPTAPSGTRVAVQEMARRHGDFAMAAALVQLSGDDARIALVNVADRPVRATAAEAALRDGAPVEEVVDLATRDLDPVSDLHATSAYRRKVAGVLVRRAIEQARRAA